MSTQNDIANYDRVMEEARKIFVERQDQYGDQWKQYGWRGCLYNLRRKAERAWRQLWGADLPVDGAVVPGRDDLLDAINYAAMCVIAIHERDRDGSFWVGI